MSMSKFLDYLKCGLPLILFVIVGPTSVCVGAYVPPTSHSSQRRIARVAVLKDPDTINTKASSFTSLFPPQRKRKSYSASIHKNHRSNAKPNQPYWEGMIIPTELPKLSELLFQESDRLEGKSLTFSSLLDNSQGGSKQSCHESRGNRKPWRAGYYTSLKSQKRIQAAAKSTKFITPVDRACYVLETFLNIPAERCNAANLVCALTSTANVMDNQSNARFRALFFQSIDVLEMLLSEQALSFRQLANVVWAIAKLYDRDERLLPRTPMSMAVSSDTVKGHAETWDLRHEIVSSPDQRLDTVIDRIALDILRRLDEDPGAAKESELCMTAWAYGIIRRRRRPPGWKHVPHFSQLAYEEKVIRKKDGNTIRFEQWNRITKSEECHDFDPPSNTEILLDKIGSTLLSPMPPQTSNGHDCSTTRLRRCKWSELANVAWSFASTGRACSGIAQDFMIELALEATRRLRNDRQQKPLSRDVAQIVWALGVLQADVFRLAESLVHFIEAIGQDWSNVPGERPLQYWSCPDLVQIALSMAHARIDDRSMLREVYTEAVRRFDTGVTYTQSSSAKVFRTWELSILLWCQARLHLTEEQGDIFSSFANLAIENIANLIRAGKSMKDIGMGPQEQANMAWSITVLKLYRRPEAQRLIRDIFAEYSTTCMRDGVIQLEHAHQLWQALFVLEGECPDCVCDVPAGFRKQLEGKWQAEKSRVKTSSERHRSLSKLLDLMGVAHYNEHDEDIDVAIVLKPQASWTHETERLTNDKAVKVAVEFDGPNHFTRQNSASPPRTLGHTVLKYRLLKRQGWTVVRIPYFEFDKIPFWASMERQRYVQRLLKTHGNIRFSDIDISEYKRPVQNRASRFD